MFPYFTVVPYLCIFYPYLYIHVEQRNLCLSYVVEPIENDLCKGSRVCEIKCSICTLLSSLRTAEFLQRRFEAQQYKIKVEKQMVGKCQTTE